VKDLFIACVDDMSGFPEALESVYPQTRVPLCMVYLVALIFTCTLGEVGTFFTQSDSSRSLESR
jgi:transposase-like protein